MYECVWGGAAVKSRGGMCIESPGASPGLRIDSQVNCSSPRQPATPDAITPSLPADDSPQINRLAEYPFVSTV